MYFQKKQTTKNVSHLHLIFTCNQNLHIIYVDKGKCILMQGVNAHRSYCKRMQSEVMQSLQVKKQSVCALPHKLKGHPTQSLAAISSKPLFKKCIHKIQAWAQEFRRPPAQQKKSRAQ